MTAERFDRVTKLLGETTTRRSVMKRLGAALLVGGGLAAVLPQMAGATTQACARLDQSAEGASCCAGLVADCGVCKRPVGGTCYATGDCVQGAECLAQTGKLGSHCVAV